MKAGLSLTDLAAKLEADKARQKDYVVDTREVKVLTSKGGTEVKLPGVEELKLNQHFHRQVGQHLKIRSDFYDRLRGDHSPLFDHLVNGLFEREPSKRMVRTYTDGAGEDGGQGVARAMLSDKYRRIDNFELAQAVLPIIGQIPEVQIPSCQVTETRMYIKVVAPLVGVDLQELLAPGTHLPLGNGGGFPVQAGFVLTNSEVGASALNIDQMLYALVCTNGLITGKLVSRRHVGAKIQAEEDLSIYRDETIAADDKALMMKVQDAVKAAVDETRFRQIAAQFAATATSTKIEKPVEAMKVLAPAVGLTEGESNSVLQHLLEGGDLTQFGAINAITRAAQDVESYDRSTELEELAATKVMAMPEGEWTKVAVAA